MDKAFADMTALEAGAIANPDEGRMVGHYWLRHPELAPTERAEEQVTEPINELKRFAEQVHTGHVRAAEAMFQTDPARRDRWLGAWSAVGRSSAG